MTIHITTTKSIDPKLEEQQAEIFPILMDLYKKGLHGLYYSRNDQGFLVICVDDNNFEHKNMRFIDAEPEKAKSEFSAYFNGLECGVTSIKSFAFPPRMSISLVSMLEKKIITSSSGASSSSTADTSTMDLKLKRLKSLNSAGAPTDNDDPVAQFLSFHNQEAVAHHIKLESGLVELFNSNSSQIPLSQIPATNEIVLSEVTNQKDIGVIILFTAAGQIAGQKGRDDADAITLALCEILSKFASIGARIGHTINYNYNALSNLISFSITLPGLTISEGSAPYFIDDVKKALYATATENSYKIASITSKTVPTPEQRAARTATPQRSETPLSQARSHTGSPISSAGDAHQRLLNIANQLITAGNCEEGFKLFMASLNTKNYGQALRRLATSDHAVALQIATEMLKFQSQLNFTINDRANENSPTALHHAAQKSNEAMYNLLVQNGADQTLVANGQTAAQMLEAAKAQVASTAQLSR